MVIDQNIINKILALPKPTIVAISGFGGSGKTTFANLLSKSLGKPVISIDSFNKDIHDYTHWELMDFNRLEKEVLIPFKNGKDLISYTHVDGEGKNPKTIMVHPKNILIVEGVGLIRPELMKYFSFSIWIDCRIDEAVRRGKKRDREVWKNPKDEQWEGIWKKNDLEYYEKFQPKIKVDMIINNSSPESF